MHDDTDYRAVLCAGFVPISQETQLSPGVSPAYGTKLLRRKQQLSYEWRHEIPKLYSASYWRDRWNLIAVYHLLKGKFWVDLDDCFKVDVDGMQKNPLKLYNPKSDNMQSVLSLSARVVNECYRLPPSLIIPQSIEVNKRHLARKFDDRLHKS